MRLAIVSPNRQQYSETFIQGHMRRLPFEKWYLHGAYLPKYVSRTVEEEGRSLNKLGFFRAFGNSADPQARLTQFLRRTKIEVLLAEYGPTGVECMEACSDAHVPLVVHFHGYDAYREDMLRSHGPRYPELFERAAAMIVVSKDMERQLLDLGATPEKLRLVHYGIDADYFQRKDFPNSANRIAAVGRLVDKKRPMAVLEIFRNVLEEMPGAKLDWVGTGPLEMEFLQKIEADPKLKAGVCWHGEVSQEGVRNILEQASVFVQASGLSEVGDSEGLPLAVLEAMAMSVPVVATRHAGIPEAVRSGREGFLLEEQDKLGMAKALIQCLQDVAMAKRMGANGQIRILDHFTQERYDADLTRILKEAAVGPHPR